MSIAAALDQAILAAGVPREAFDGVSIGIVAKGEVLDGPRSVVVRQAGNRLHAQKALLLEMLAGEGA